MFNHLRSLSGKLHMYSLSYNNFIIVSNFNIEMEEQQIRMFFDNYGLKNAITQSTC